MKKISNNELKKYAAGIKYFFTDVDGTLTNGKSFYSIEGEILKQFSLRDGTGFYLLKKLGIEAGIITGENSEIVSRRAEKLSLKLCFLGIGNKLACIENFSKEANCNLNEIAFIGDDLNDYEIMQNVGISFCPSDAHYKIKEVSNVVLQNKGGEEAFREAVEQLIYYRGEDLMEVFNR